MVELLWAPLLACLLLTAIHVYLGLHVLARGVIFVDLALAQVAALGVTIAFLAGHSIQSAAAYWYALVFTLGGAALFEQLEQERWQARLTYARMFTTFASRNGVWDALCARCIS